MKFSVIKSIRYFFFFIAYMLSIHSFSIANDDPDPELVKYYTELMDDKKELELGANYLSYDLGLGETEWPKNPLGDKRTIALAEALKDNKTLTYLNLRGLHIDDKGAQALANALKVNKTLRRLDLEFNRINAKGFQALANALKVNTALRQLNVIHEDEYDEWDSEEDMAPIKEINRQLSINARLPELLRANWPKVKQLFLGFNEADSVLSKVPKEVILKILGTVLDLEKR